MKETLQEAQERLKDLPIKVGMLMVAQDSTSSILMICGKHKNTPGEGTKSMYEFCWMNRGGNTTVGGTAYVHSIVDWAADHRADYLYHLCVNDLGNFPKKEQEV